LEHIFQFSFR